MTTELAHAVHDACHLTGEFTLRSGQVADEYFDKYLFESDPQLLRAVAERLAAEGIALLPALRRTDLARAAAEATT